MVRWETLSEKVLELIVAAEVSLPSDVKEQLAKLYGKSSGLAKVQLKALLDNVEVAERKRVPICQDTGLLTFYVKKPPWLSAAAVKKVIHEAVRKATREAFLRTNVVHPFTRGVVEGNVGLDNPIIYFEPRDDGEARIDLLVKGAGSENNCIAFSLTPKEGVEGLISAVVDHVARRGGASCPPLIVGVGIGGTLDYAVHLSKRVLFAPINEGGEASELEEKLQREIDRLEIGVMGLGEGPTVMKVKIAYAGCHTASLPVAINIQCWALRRRSLVFNEKGEFTLW